MTPPGAADRLFALLAAGDFAGDESRRLVAALAPLSLLLRAVERIDRSERVAAWYDVRAAVASAPRNGLVRILAARLLYVLGDFGDALDAAETAWDLGVASAGMLRYHQARDLGRYDAAAVALEDVLRAGERASSDAPSPRVLAYALEHLLALYFDHHHDTAAAVTARRYARSANGSPAIDLRMARIHDRCGQTEEALRAVRAAASTVTPDASGALNAAAVMLEIGAFDDARALYQSLLDRVGAPAAEALATLALWTGDTEHALFHADALADLGAAGAASRIRGAVLVLRRDYRAALPLLDAALAANPDDAEAHLWRAEALVRLGDRDAALASADRGRHYGYSFAAAVIHLLAALPAPAPGGVAPSPATSEAPRRRATDPVDGAVFHAQQELRAELIALVPDASALLDTPMTTPQLTDLLDRALAAMRGNRTFLGTWVRPDGVLARVPPTAAPRLLSREAFEPIRVGAVDESFRRLDALAERFPDSSMPIVHRGELHLWLGHYDEARADLERAIAIRRRTRWAWYGLAWLHIVSGDPERGLAVCAEGIAAMKDTEGPPAFGCRGEAYRLLGRLDDAREQLQRSCELTPTRISAWVDLALVHGAAGDPAAQAAVFARVVRLAPVLVSHAARELGDDVFTSVVLAAPFGEQDTAARIEPGMMTNVLAHALAMMRGNRASSLVTYFTADGQMHHVPRYGGPSHGGEPQALDKMRTVLRRGLGEAAA